MRRPRQREDGGSVMILVLFVCLACALLLQVAWATILCAQGALADEGAGRERLKERDVILGILRDRAVAQWQPMPWSSMGRGEGTLEAHSDDEPGLLRARARAASPSGVETVAVMERGKDGLDLPVAALVAGYATADPGRTEPWVRRQADAGASDGGPNIPCILVRVPQDIVLGPGCEIREAREAWRLGDGWTQPFIGPENGPGIHAPGMAPSARVAYLSGGPGTRHGVPGDGGSTGPGEPALVVITGGGTLDARNLGTFWGVLVADGGSVLLEGTTVHGAVIASKSVSFGARGQVWFNRRILRWATDRSFDRARLIPGTRWEEGMD